MDTEGAIIASEQLAEFIQLDRIFPDPSHPLEIDIGCGKGRFLLAHAVANPGINILGIDRLMGRLRKIEKKLARLQIANTRLLHLDAYHVVEYMLPARSVSAFFAFFPDPWPKRRHHRRRLFSPAFLDALNRTLVAGGLINVATDHPGYFTEIVKVFADDPRFIEIRPPFLPRDEERTDFELQFMAQNLLINRASYQRA